MRLSFYTTTLRPDYDTLNRESPEVARITNLLALETPAEALLPASSCIVSLISIGICQEMLEGQSGQLSS